MSGPVSTLGVGLDALRAAVADARREELARDARSALVSGDERVAHRVSTSRRAGRGSGRGGGAATVQPGGSAVTVDLVRRAQEGDAEAFGELYDRYVELVHRYIAYRVGNRQLAEDLTSETFLRALRRIRSFTWQGHDIGAWFVTIARNLIADHYKSSRYRLELTTDDVSAAAGASSVLSPTAEGPEAQVLDAMQNRLLLEAVRTLGAEQQECVVLRFLQGMSVAETALVMDKSEGAVKALQYRAVRALARVLPAAER